MEEFSFPLISSMQKLSRGGKYCLSEFMQEAQSPEAAWAMTQPEQTIPHVAELSDHLQEDVAVAVRNSGTKGWR